MIIARPIDGERRVGVLVKLVGTCDHEIDVLVKAAGADAEAIEQAVSKGMDHALLTRFCPFCMQDRSFRFPLVASVPVAREPIKTYLESQPSPTTSGSFDLLTAEFVAPSERAYRMWEAARQPGAREPGQAVRDLRLAADIFDRQGRFMQRLGVLEDLAALLDKQDQGDEASVVRRRIEEEYHLSGR